MPKKLRLAQLSDYIMICFWVIFFRGIKHLMSNRKPYFLLKFKLFRGKLHSKSYVLGWWFQRQIHREPQFQKSPSEVITIKNINDIIFPTSELRQDFHRTGYYPRKLHSKNHRFLKLCLGYINISFLQ